MDQGVPQPENGGTDSSAGHRYAKLVSGGADNFDGNATNDPSGAIASGNAIASWLLGFPSVGQLNENLTWNGYRFWEPNVWFQDDWRVNRKLTCKSLTMVWREKQS